MHYSFSNLFTLRYIFVVQLVYKVPVPTLFCNFVCRIFEEKLSDNSDFFSFNPHSTFISFQSFIGLTRVQTSISSLSLPTSVWTFRFLSPRTIFTQIKNINLFQHFTIYLSSSLTVSLCQYIITLTLY